MNLFRRTLWVTLSLAGMYVALQVLRNRDAEPPAEIERSSSRTDSVSQATGTSPEHGGDQRADLRQDPQSGSVTLELLSRREEPLAGLHVGLFHEFPGGSDGEAETNGEGWATLDLPAGRYRVEIRGVEVPTIVLAEPLVLSAGESEHRTIFLGDSDRSISGRVLSRAGEAVPAVRIRGRNQTTSMTETSMILEVVSGPDGDYCFDGVASGNYRLTTEVTERYGSVSKVYRAGEQSADLVVDVLRELEVFGEVTSRSGDPLGNVVITPDGQSARQARTGSDGKYFLKLAINGWQTIHTVTGAAPGYKRTREQIRRAEFEEATEWRVDIVMDPVDAVATLRGILRDTSGYPLGGETVNCSTASLNVMHQATTESNGLFCFDQVAMANDYQLIVQSRANFKDYARGPIEVPEEGLDVEIWLEPLESGAIWGIIVDPLGNPIPKFSLSVRNHKARKRPLEITSDHDGRFDVDGVPFGDLLIETWASPVFKVRGVRLEESRSQELRLVLDYGDKRLSGIVVDEHESPVAGAQVTLNGSHASDGLRSSSVRSAHTDVEGRFFFTQLASGRHVLTARLPRRPVLELNYEVGNRTDDVILRLRPENDDRAR